MDIRRYLYIFYIFIIFSGYVINSEEPELIKVHFICHSHCDAGWLKTFEGYYNNQVKDILTHVVDGINKNEIRRFVWSEMGYLERWWNTVSEEYRNNFKKAVLEKRIEIINGGWVMNDEACPTVDAVIRQLADGHRFIQEHFGAEFLPRSGWQIDPFGHNTLSAYIQAQMGYKHIVLDRIHYELKGRMKTEKNLQFLWRGSPDTTGPKSDILAHTLDDFYFSPEYLYFEPPGNIEYYNLERNIPDIINYAKEKAKYFKSPHILFPMGGDFFFTRAESWMNRIDEIVKRFETMYKEKKTNVQVVYSTLSEFFNQTLEWHQSHSNQFNYYDHDFFPYADKPEQYWTGYYTSRPKLKGDSRDISSKLRSAEVFSISLQEKENFDLTLFDASKNCSILQHHDAITGTARQPVVDDYFSRLYYANNQINQVIQNSISNAHTLAPKLRSIDNDTVIDFNTHQVNQQMAFIITNSLNWKRKDIFTIRIKIDSTKGDTHCPFILYKSDGNTIIKADCSKRQEVFLDAPSSPKEIFIQMDFYVEIPSFGIETFILKEQEAAKNSEMIRYIEDTGSYLKPGSIIKTNEIYLKVSQNYLIESVKYHFNGQSEVKIDQSLIEYKDDGGAYLFLTYQEPINIHQNNSKKEEFKVHFYNGELVKEVLVEYSMVDLVRYRIYNSPDSEINKKLNFNIMVAGKQAIQSAMLFNTSISNKYMYSDNGLELIKRKVPENTSKPYTNYYPSVQLSMISDDITKQTFVCAGDRARGVASLKSGRLEFALHRSLNKDDDKGLQIIAVDQQPINVKTQCYLDTLSNTLKNSRKDALLLEHPLRALVIQDYKHSSQNIQLSGLNHDLPDNIHILSIEKKSKENIVLRVVNIREIGVPTSFNINNLFKILKNGAVISKEFDLTNIREYNSNDLSHIPFRNNSIIDNTEKSISSTPPRFTPILSKTIVTLFPLEIKSFSISSQ